MRFPVIWMAAASLVSGAACAAEVSSATLAVTLDDASRGAVARLATAHGAELAPWRETTPLFRVKLTRSDNLASNVWLSADDAGTFSCGADGTNSLRLVYGGFSNCVTYVTCIAKGGGDAVRWAISVQTAPGWALEETEYPRILVAPALGSDGGDDRFVCGSASGGVMRYPGARRVGWRVGARHPGALAAQFASVYDDRAGICLSAEDAAGHAKYIGAERVEGGVLLSNRRFGFDTGLVASAYDVATGGFEGTPAEPCTWHDAADLYRAWAGKQPWCATWFRNREDVPAWMRDAPVVARFGHEWLEKPEDVRAWIRGCWKRVFVPSPLLAAFSGWEKLGSDVLPECFPVRPGDEEFSKLAVEMRADGVHAFVRPCGHHWARTYAKRDDGTFAWDGSEAFERDGHAHAAFGRDGSRVAARHAWLRGGTCACMCGGDAWTREWWNSAVCAPLSRLGCEVMMFDPKGVFPECWSNGHGHAPGAGLWQTDALRGQIVAMKAAMLTNGVEEAVVGVAGPCEFRNPIVGVQDCCSVQSQADEWASVFSYLYHEYVPMYMSHPGRPDRVALAHAAADGQMPVILPSMTDAKDGVDDFMRRWVAYYHGEGREWLAFGRQVKPPRIACAMQRHLRPGSGKKSAVTRPTVFCGAFVSAEGKKAIVLVNSTLDPQPVTLYRGGARASLELAGGEIRLLK